MIILFASCESSCLYVGYTIRWQTTAQLRVGFVPLVFLLLTDYMVHVIIHSVISTLNSSLGSRGDGFQLNPSGVSVPVKVR